MNVNSVRNKFEALEFLIKDKFDVFLVGESKLDSSFPETQFKLPGYRIFRQDQDKYGGGLMFYINQNIPCKKIETFQFTSSIEVLTLEINLGKEKILIFGTYKPPNINNSSFLNELYNAITFYSTLYKTCVFLGDLNIVWDNTQLQNFCECFLLEHLIKKPTCYKGDTPTGIDHIITNIPKRFMKSIVLETGISDHHKMITTFFRSTFAKGKRKTFYYRCYKKFNLEQFQMKLKEKLDEISNNSFDIFLEEFKTCLDKFAPLKEKKIRFNNSIFMTKILRKAIMLRFQLQKKFNNNNSKENSKKYK